MIYDELILLEPMRKTFVICYTEQYVMNYCFRLLTNAFEEQLAFQRALREFVGGIDSSYVKEHEEFFIGFEGSFGAKHVTPRTLTSRFIGNLVCVEGIVTKCRYPYFPVWFFKLIRVYVMN